MSFSFALPDVPPVHYLDTGTYHRLLSSDPKIIFHGDGTSAAVPRGYSAESFNTFENCYFDKRGTFRNKDDNRPVARSRFAPLNNGSGKVVPTLYLAQSQEAAYCETMLRPQEYNDLYFQNVLNSTRAKLQLNTRLTLLNIVPPYIDDTQSSAFGISAGNLLYGDVSTYGNSNRFASEVYQAYPELQGMRWNSRQYPNNSVYILFGDRIESSALTCLGEYPALSKQEISYWLPIAAQEKLTLDKKLVEELMLLV